ncbi:MAG: CoB--CoM heterodisulfide reductase iron-sulfur subunit A family protein [Candidatus Omnitrophota bacterium]
MKGNGQEKRIGVYICHCGSNIASVIDVKALAEFGQSLPHVKVSREYKYMCSDPGQELIRADIRENHLNRIVVAACSPLLHEKTFRHTAKSAGLNPFLFQMANIREQISWVTKDSGLALDKAKSYLAAAVHRVALHDPLETRSVSIIPRVMIVGGGIAGIEAALTLAEAGKEVILVERQPTIGGHMAMFDKTFPTLDCAACILTPKMTAVKDNPKIRLLTYSDVQSVTGSVGNYHVEVLRHARYIIENMCVGCMLCIQECLFKTGKTPNEFDLGLAMRKPVYIPFPQAVPPIPVIDRDACIEFRTGKCKKTCVEACADRQAIDFTQKDWIEEFDVGAIIVSTGFQVFNPSSLSFYRYGQWPNIYTSLEVERLLNAAGPTSGKIALKDGSVPQSVGIVHCVGSRDENHHRYCSRVCCMYSLKLAHLIKERTGADIYNFYIDIRTPGKGFEEFFNRVQEEGVYFIRGKVGDVSLVKDGNGKGRPGQLQVQVDDTILGTIRHIAVDMVILSVALEPRADADAVRKLFGISCSAEGFFLEKHPKLAPVNTASDGVFIAGACQGPKDIPDTVAQADAAAGKALALIDCGQMSLEPNTAFIAEEACSGCKICSSLCPFDAIRTDTEKKISVIDQTLCKGCGTCVAACPSGAARQNMFTDEQIFEEIEGILCYV